MQEPSFGDPVVADTRPPDARPGRARRLETILLVAAVALLAVLIALVWWGLPSRQARPPATTGVPALAASAPAAPAAASVPSTPASVLAPNLPAVAGAAPLPALDESDIELARLLDGILGHEAMALLRPTQLVRNMVATVDNLDRTHAPRLAWPVATTPSRFTTDTDHGQTVISADNDLRYAPFVQLTEAADIPAVVALYLRWYPLLQQAYQELGYPGRSFHVRLLAIIDHLLAAPEPPRPVAVEPLQVNAPTPLLRPWQHMVFVDPALESLSAGQKIMVRVGPVNERRLKTRLRTLRDALLQASRQP